ncbi:MAG: OB-fold protein [Desulfitobacteriaceae bacterium]
MSTKMVNCKACGKEIGKGVKKCINCGTDQRNFFGKHKIITGILAIVIIAGIGSAMGGEGGSKTTTADSSKATANTPTTTQQPKEDPMVVTVDKLVEDLDGNALSASETYNGKYVEVTGELSVIDSAGKYFTINPLSGAFTLTGVQCRITQEQKGTVAKFTSKQKLTVTGTITDVGEIMGYAMKVESIE